MNRFVPSEFPLQMLHMNEQFPIYPYLHFWINPIDRNSATKYQGFSSTLQVYCPSPLDPSTDTDKPCNNRFLHQMPPDVILAALMKYNNKKICI
ncbi:hypothetical protein H5410_017884 [Solanum commersonii]|uniref:Uncharacterized protein n=1 Tax=Solanum commersonii TaxID=4109 RepID=A0A9J6A1L9_SOLCO|nr:hypothetical protein H5410_017884 [Solanum commersonii]